MSEDDAWTFIDFMVERLTGWSVALATNGANTTDWRTRRAREASRLSRDIWTNIPCPYVIAERFKAGQDVSFLWPESLRPIVRFEIEHLVPRAVNEPLHRERQHGTWPIWLWRDYAKPATVEDHPPAPASSILLKRLMAGEVSRVAEIVQFPHSMSSGA